MSSFWCDEDVGSVPEADRAEELKANFEGQCQKAADALASADILLLVTGAGFSADSGLAVYNDVAKCFNDYRATNPHEGYDVLARWGKDKNSSTSSHGGVHPINVALEIQARVGREVTLRRPFDEDVVAQNTAYEVQSGPAGAFFSFTSNVDAHLFDKFEAHEIYECHGNIETWQCSDSYCTSGIWRALLHHTFLVNKQTMLALPDDKDALKEPPDDVQDMVQQNKPDRVPHIGQTKGTGVRHSPLRHMPPTKDTKGWLTDSWPRCGHCQSLARPAILMFGDFGWKADSSQAKRWSLWKESVLDLCEKRGRANPLKICVIEVGCGLNVPTSRGASERMVMEVLDKGGDISLVRINPDFPLSNDSAISDNLIPIMSKGLRAITQIDQLYRSRTES